MRLSLTLYISFLNSHLPVLWNPLTLTTGICTVVISVPIILQKWNEDNLRPSQKDGNELKYIFYSAGENNLCVFLYETWIHGLIHSSGKKVIFSIIKHYDHVDLLHWHHKETFGALRVLLIRTVRNLEIVDLSSTSAEVQKNELHYGEKKLGFWELQGF